FNSFSYDYTVNKIIEAGLKPETESFPALPASCLLESMHEPQLWLWALGCLSSLHRQGGGYGTRSQPPMAPGKPNHEDLNLIQQERPSSL
ncbi:AT-rich interactive domain-containing protein 1B, partial [Lamprotornis superbus]